MGTVLLRRLRQTMLRNKPKGRRMAAPMAIGSPLTIGTFSSTGYHAVAGSVTSTQWESRFPHLVKQVFTLICLTARRLQTETFLIKRDTLLLCFLVQDGMPFRWEHG